MTLAGWLAVGGIGWACVAVVTAVRVGRLLRRRLVEADRMTGEALARQEEG